MPETDVVERIDRLAGTRPNMVDRIGGATRAGAPDALNEAIDVSLAMGAQPEAATVARSVVSAFRRKALSERLALSILQRLLPPLGTASIVPTIRLDDVDEPRDAESYRKTLRTIWRAGVKEGRIGLDEARKAMILTKTLWRAELEVAALEARSDGRS